jgi:hypothetical protein
VSHELGSTHIIETQISEKRNYVTLDAKKLLIQLILNSHLKDYGRSWTQIHDEHLLPSPICVDGLIDGAKRTELSGKSIYWFHSLIVQQLFLGMVLAIMRIIDPLFVKRLSKEMDTNNGWSGLHSRCGLCLTGFGIGDDKMEMCKKYDNFSPSLYLFDGFRISGEMFAFIESLLQYQPGTNKYWRLENEDLYFSFIPAIGGDMKSHQVGQASGGGSHNAKHFCLCCQVTKIPFNTLLLYSCR